MSLTVARLDPLFAAVSVAYMATLFYLSSLPGHATGPNTPVWRFVSNAAHVPLFAGLACCLALTFRDWPPGQRAAWVGALGFAYALLDEWHQSWVPERSMSLVDVGFDLTGVVLVVLILRPWRGQP